MRTADEIVGRPGHEVARAMRLEVRQRQRLQVREEVVPHVVLDVAGRPDENSPLKKEEHPSDQPDGEQQRAVRGQLAAGDPARQIVDGEAEDGRPRQRHGPGDDHAGETEAEFPPIADDVLEKPADRRHDSEYSEATSGAGRRFSGLRRAACAGGRQAL